jgi:hypothetical protein
MGLLPGRAPHLGRQPHACCSFAPACGASFERAPRPPKTDQRHAVRAPVPRTPDPSTVLFSLGGSHDIQTNGTSRILPGQRTLTLHLHSLLLKIRSPPGPRLLSFSLHRRRVVSLQFLPSRAQIATPFCLPGLAAHSCRRPFMHVARAQRAERNRELPVWSGRGDAAEADAHRRVAAPQHRPLATGWETERQARGGASTVRTRSDHQRPEASLKSSLPMRTRLISDVPGVWGEVSGDVGAVFRGAVPWMGALHFTKPLQSTNKTPHAPNSKGAGPRQAATEM